jgi:hypothetical protein
VWVSLPCWQLFSRCDDEAPPGTDDIKQSAFLGGTGKAARERGLVVVVVPETRLALMSMQVRLSAATTNSDSGRLPPSPGIHTGKERVYFLTCSIFNEQYTDKKKKIFLKEIKRGRVQSHI